MCGRFTLTNPNPRRLASRFDLDPDFEIDDRPRFNIAPTDPVIAIRRGEPGHNEAGVLRWGLVPGQLGGAEGPAAADQCAGRDGRDAAGVPGVVRASGAA